MKDVSVHNLAGDGCATVEHGQDLAKGQDAQDVGLRCVGPALLQGLWQMPSVSREDLAGRQVTPGTCQHAQSAGYCWTEEAMPPASKQEIE